MIASGVVGFGPGTTGVMVCGVVVVTVGLVAGIVGVTLGSGSTVTAGGVAGFGPGTTVGVMVCGVVAVTVGFVGERATAAGSRRAFSAAECGPEARPWSPAMTAGSPAA